MSKRFFAIAVSYVAVTLVVGTSALLTTLWAYNVDERMVSDTVTAAIINTAAAVAAMGFFGGFDMIFTIWQFLRNQEAEQARNQEREEERKVRAEERKAHEEERKVRAEERAAARAEREEIMAMLRDEHQRNQELHARVMELSELAIQRANGSRSNGDAESSRGE